MTPEERHLLEVARAIAERSPVDWAEADRSAADGSLRETLRELRVIAGIAALHGSDRQPDTAERWGPLTLLEHIGHGSFGDVYRALDTRLDREVALKLMRRSDTQGDPVGTSVIEEARLLARVRHPNVVTIYGADRIDGRVGLWMEFVRGRTLEELLQARGPLPSDEVTTIGRDICHALAAVHEAGLLHRDIKAQNVVLEPGGRLVLMDFGAGREAGDGDEEALAGTPLYLAPEVLAGRPATVHSDIYSVGVLLFHLLTGSYPVTGRTVPEIRDAHRRGTGAALGRDVSPALAAVVHRALQPDPARRYGFAAEMAAALGRSELRHRDIMGAAPAVAAALVVTGLTAVAAWLLGAWPLPRSSERALMETPRPSAAGSAGATLGEGRATAGPRQVCYGCGDEGGSIDSSGRFMVATDRSVFDPYHLVVRDMTKTTRRDAVLASGARGTAFNPVLSSDARKVAFEWRTPEGRAQLRVRATAGGSEPTIVLDDAAYLAITPAAWFPDERSILATIERPDHSMDLVRVTEADGVVHVLKPLGWRLRGVRGRPALSADGGFVAYSALASAPGSASEPVDSTDQHIYVLAADDSARESVVVQERAINESPIWTPDGENILFLSDISGTWDLRTVPIRNGVAVGGPTEVWRDLGCRCITLHRVSGGLLFYTKRPPVQETTEVVEMEWPGRNVKGTHVVAERFAGTLPAWSPDGGSLATKAMSVEALAQGRVREVLSSDFETTVYPLNGAEPKHFPRLSRRTPVVWLDHTVFLETVRNEHGVEALHRVDVQTGMARRLFDYQQSILTQTMAVFSQPSADGKELYVVRLDRDNKPRQIAALDIHSGRMKRTIPDLGTEDIASLKLSPDGQTLAFVIADESRTALGRVDVSGSNYLELYSLDNPEEAQVRPMLAWTSDGRGILFVVEEPLSSLDLPTLAPFAPGSRDVHVLTRQRVMYVDANRESPPALTGVEVDWGRVQDISLHPDGSRLAYGLLTGAQELWSLDLSPSWGGRK